MLATCLRTIANQMYPEVEIIIVDSGSTDTTNILSKRYHARFLTYHPNVPKGTFDAPNKRNYGVKQAKGSYVYIVDADMELPPGLIAEAVTLCEHGANAVIIPEDSFGIGPWARAKNLERRCYWGDDSVEAPRFFNKKVWNTLGGLDESLGGGGDDWDMHEKLKNHGYSVGRTTSVVRHNEGNLSLTVLMRKRFMYGRDAIRYIRKRPVASTVSYFPIRMAFIRHWYLFLTRPADTVCFAIMRSLEYAAGLTGVVYSWMIRT